MGRVHPQVGSGHSASSASEFEKTHETKQENVFTFLDFEKPKKTQHNLTVIQWDYRRKVLCLKTILSQICCPLRNY